MLYNKYFSPSELFFLVENQHLIKIKCLVGDYFKLILIVKLFESIPIFFYFLNFYKEILGLLAKLLKYPNQRISLRY